MIKTALNAMSRRGYRRLDLAHRMFNQAEDGLNNTKPDNSFPKTTQRRLDGAKKQLGEQRHDLLHPKGRNSDVLHGLTIRGQRRQDHVDPKLARKARSLHSKAKSGFEEKIKASKEYDSDFDKMYYSYPRHVIDDQNHPDRVNLNRDWQEINDKRDKKRKLASMKTKKSFRNFDSNEDSHLYRPDTVEKLPSAKIKDHIKSRGFGDIGRVKLKKKGLNENSSSLKNDRQMSIVKDTINSAINRVRKR